MVIRRTTGLASRPRGRGGRAAQRVEDVRPGGRPEGRVRRRGTAVQEPRRDGRRALARQPGAVTRVGPPTSRTGSPAAVRRAASSSAERSEGHIASSPPATRTSAAPDLSTGILAASTRSAKVRRLRSYQPRMATGVPSGRPGAGVQASSRGTNGSGSPRQVQDDLYGRASPSRPGPTLAQVSEVGESATTASIPGSSTDRCSAASAPLDVPRTPIRRAPPARSTSIAAPNVSSGTSHTPGGCPGPPNQRIDRAAMPSRARIRHRSSSMRPLDPESTSTPASAPAAGRARNPSRTPG